MAEQAIEQTEHHDGGTDLLEAAAKPALSRPPLYKVILINDDFTPMEFVVHVLVEIFHIDPERATQIMLEVHTKGQGICGVYPRDIAQTKVDEVSEYSEQHNHPLKCSMEKSD